jgi:hypothetical protein
MEERVELMKIRLNLLTESNDDGQPLDPGFLDAISCAFLCYRYSGCQSSKFEIEPPSLSYFRGQMFLDDSKTADDTGLDFRRRLNSLTMSDTSYSFYLIMVTLLATAAF